jgi:hypothetical protein
MYSAIRRALVGSVLAGNCLGSLDVRYGSKADIEALPPNVRFTPQKQTWFTTIVMSALCQKQTLGKVRLMSALPPKADIRRRERHVRFVP